ncbi:uncharacterized [Tachysurus ichikawai]
MFVCAAAVCVSVGTLFSTVAMRTRLFRLSRYILPERRSRKDSQTYPGSRSGKFPAGLLLQRGNQGQG